MDLWIRSQDKETLCKIDDIHIEEQSIYTDTHLKVCLGTYATKERALEVLDEIYQRLIDLQALEIDTDFCTICKRSLECVYEMPKE